MHMRQTGKAALTGALFLSICLFVLAACGSNTSASTAPGASATATACAKATRPATNFSTAIGTVSSITGQTFVLRNTQGKNVTVSYTNSTTFTQEVKLASSDLKEGSSVRVTVTSANNTYTAVNITVSQGSTTGSGTGGFSGFPGGFGFRGTPGTRGNGNPCFANRGRGTPGAGFGNGNSNFRGLNGTVSQLNGNVLTIADSSGGSYTVTLTAQTQIITTKSATAAALKAGEALTVVGKPGSQGAITANSIAILLALPKRGPTATPTAS
jgi:uncharacterized protein YcfL